MSFGLLHTPFHARTAERNLAHSWVKRGAFSVPAQYGEPHQEALAARVSAVLIDATALEDLRIEGRGAVGLLAAACGPHIRDLAVGASLPVHWCADGGGVRGLGSILRFSESEFVLRSADADFGWFASAAPRFAATVRDVTRERGVLLLSGPFARSVLDAIGFKSEGLFEDGVLRVNDRRGLEVTLWHDPQLRSFQISCAADGAQALLDDVLRAGQPMALRLAGQHAFDVLQVETGALAPNVDFTPARTPFAREPLPSALGLNSGPGTGTDASSRVLAGLELDRDEPRSFAPVYRETFEVGTTLRSVYSLTLRRAIALAQLMPQHASLGTKLCVRNGAEEIHARVVALPFL